MRIAQEVTTLEAGGALSVRRSTMKTTRKTFRMNIDAIYSDKIGAAVRELPANAFDSHRRAKQSRPFYVHCPTLLDPRFWVRDFGVGMSDDTMGDTYIVVGESDKEDTNDEVGMWGLGSKSPFAYTDQYNITCFDGETARHYGYGIAEDGVPALYLMHQEPCSDPQGVQVSYAVESRDFDAFKRAIEKVAMAYDPGSFESNITLPNLGELLLRGDGWCAFDDEGKRLTGSRWYARQGCVLYPITSQEVKRPSDYNTKATYILDCPIGTIRITPSRESIEYTSEVIDYLNARIERVQEETIEAIDEATKDIVSVVEFFKAVTKLKPAYINHNFTHPATGLTSAVLPATFPLTFFEPKFEHERWEFAAPGTLALESIPKRDAIYLVDDISPLYDPSRAEHIGGLSRSEIRRISRFTRAFLEKKDQRSALFIFNAGWTPEFREACFGTTPLTDLKFSELKDAVPTRVAPPKAEMKPPIRGLALAKGAGEQKPVFEIDPAQKGVAWVSSEQYRRQSANLFRLAKRFDITALYIAAPPVQEKMEDPRDQPSARRRARRPGGARPCVRRLVLRQGKAERLRGQGLHRIPGRDRARRPEGLRQARGRQG
jgi:hypothetical protein